MPLYADGVSYQAYYSEVGKAYYKGKDLTEVRSPQWNIKVKKSNNNSPLQFRAPDITLQQLRELSKKWGENRSKVIIRCIERAWLNEISLQQKTTVQNKGE